MVQVDTPSSIFDDEIARCKPSFKNLVELLNLFVRFSPIDFNEVLEMAQSAYIMGFIELSPVSELFLLSRFQFSTQDGERCDTNGHGCGLFNTVSRWEDESNILEAFREELSNRWQLVFDAWKIKKEKQYLKLQEQLQKQESAKGIPHSPTNIQSEPIIQPLMKGKRGRKSTEYSITKEIKSEIKSIFEILELLEEKKEKLTAGTKTYSDISNHCEELKCLFGATKAWNPFLKTHISPKLQPFFPNVIETKSIAEALFEGEHGCFSK